jgi:hypothetical protein
MKSFWAVFVGLSLFAVRAEAAPDPSWFDRNEAVFGADIVREELNDFVDSVLDHQPQAIDLVKAAHEAAQDADKLHKVLSTNLDYVKYVVPAEAALDDAMALLEIEWQSEALESNNAVAGKYDSVQAWWDYLDTQFHPGAGDGLVCSPTVVGGYLPQRPNGQFMGPANGYGFGDFNSCQKAVTEASEDAICLWTGYTFLPYDLMFNHPVGGSEQFGFAAYETCKQAIDGQVGKLICSWTGQSFLPYRLPDAKPIAGPLQTAGFADLPFCQQAISVQKNNLVCSWTGQAFLPHRASDGARIGNLAGFGYATINDCQQAVTHSTPQLTCSWTGFAHRIFWIATGEPVGPIQASLPGCLAAIGTL